MNTIYRLVLLCSFLILSACSSSIQTTQYYLLDSSPNLTVKKQAPYYQGELTVNIAEYIDKPYIAMLINDNQIHYSLFHLWAQPLQKSIENILIKKLSSGIETDIKIKSDRAIVIDIEHFHATDQSTVILSGQYQLSKGVASEPTPFYFETKLEQDGYSHSVKKMRELTILLVDKLSDKTQE